MYRPKLSDLPPILIDNDGNKVTTVSAWETKRRGEIYDIFADKVYGRVPSIDIDAVSYTHLFLPVQLRLESTVHLFFPAEGFIDREQLLPLPNAGEIENFTLVKFIG